MNFIYIDGTETTLLGLRDIPDALLQLATNETLASGQLRVAAYATDRAITEIETRGLMVTIVENNEQLQARIDNLFEQIDGGGVA